MIVGGLILVEVVFSYPGVGLTLQQAALGHDYPVVQAIVVVSAGVITLESSGALGSPTGGTFVALNAGIELQGDITIAGDGLMNYLGIPG